MIGSPRSMTPPTRPEPALVDAALSETERCIARHAIVQASIHLANKDIVATHEDLVVALDALARPTRPQLDPDPLTVEPEPVATPAAVPRRMVERQAVAFPAHPSRARGRPPPDPGPLGVGRAGGVRGALRRGRRVVPRMSAHRWSGWPGAWCLDCGLEDADELDLAGPPAEVHHRYSKVPHTAQPCQGCSSGDCPDYGSDRHNPYAGRSLEP